MQYLLIEHKSLQYSKTSVKELKKTPKGKFYQVSNFV